MKKTLLISLICFTASLSMAQTVTWCPPGAQWHCGYGDVGQRGYVELTYVSDTTIAGIACHKLTEHSRFLEVWTGMIWDEYIDRFTYESNGVVYGSGDTLFDFNAQPGQTWHMPQYDISDYVQVEDTGHNIIQGYNLKWFTISYHGVGASGFIDTIYERIGCIGFGYPFQIGNGFSDPTKGFFCNYSDSAFGVWDTTDVYCTDLSLGIDEQVITSNVFVFPNPITTVMNVVTNNPANYELSLYDVTGRIVLHQPLSKITSINTANIPKGIYMYEVKNKTDVVKKGNVIKQ
ncbi:MAG: T9SS type A sorting domain-containing protein [Bacteroidia bacterium]